MSSTALLPAEPLVNVFYEDGIKVTRQRNLFPGSVQTLTISDVTAADYTFTIGPVLKREIRPYTLVPIAVTNTHFTHDVAITVASPYHLTGDRVEFTWAPSQIVAGRTITVTDDAASPNTLFTITSATSSTSTQASREVVLLPSGLWQAVSVPSAGTVQPGGSGATLTKLLVATATYDAASITAPNTTSTTIAVVGAVAGDYVVATLTTLSTAAQLTAYVSAADTVTVVVGAYTGTVNLASGTLNVLVLKAA